MPVTRPAADEYASYFRPYVDLVPDGHIVDLLQELAGEPAALLDKVTPEGSLHRYDEGKWSVRQVIAHVIDVERVFGYRALWFARNQAAPLPGFGEDAAAAVSGADWRQLESLLAEFSAVRDATVALYSGLPVSAWRASGTAGGSLCSVNALACITLGHQLHHQRVLQERYAGALAGS